MEYKFALLMNINSQTMKVANIIHHIMTCNNNYNGNKAYYCACPDIHVVTLGCITII